MPASADSGRGTASGRTRPARWPGRIVEVRGWRASRPAGLGDRPDVRKEAEGGPSLNNYAACLLRSMMGAAISAPETICMLAELPPKKRPLSTAWFKESVPKNPLASASEFTKKKKFKKRKQRTGLKRALTEELISRGLANWPAISVAVQCLSGVSGQGTEQEEPGEHGRGRFADSGGSARRRLWRETSSPGNQKTHGEVRTR